MLDRVYAEQLAGIATEGGWRARLESRARADWALYERHPWVVAGRGRPARRSGPTRRDVFEATLAAVDGIGLTGDEMVAVVTLVAGYVGGVARGIVEAVAEGETPRGRGSLVARSAAPCSSGPRPTPPSGSRCRRRLGEEGVFDGRPRRARLPGRRDPPHVRLRPRSGCSTASPSWSTPAPGPDPPARGPPSAPSRAPVTRRRTCAPRDPRRLVAHVRDHRGRSSPRRAPGSIGREVTEPLHDAVGGAGRRPAAGRGRARPRPSTSKQADALLRGAEGVWALVHDRRLLAEVEGVCTTLAPASPPSRPASTRPDGPTAGRRRLGGTPPRGRPTAGRRAPARGGQRRGRPPQGRRVGRREGPRPHRPRRGRPGRQRAGLGGDRGLHVDPAGAVRHRSARGAGPRLRRPARPRPRPRARRRQPRRRRAPRGRASDPLFRSGTVRVGRRLPVVRLQGGRRDRRAGRQHPGAARRPRGPTSCCAWPFRRRPRGRRRARAHPLGLGGHHQPAQRPPGRQRRGGRRRRSRSSSPRSTATSTTSPTSRRSTACRSPPRSPPTPRSSPPSSPAASPRAPTSPPPSATPSPASRGRSPSPPSAAPSPTSCCSPCGAAARPSTSAWPTAPTSWPASPTA